MSSHLTSSALLLFSTDIYFYSTFFFMSYTTHYHTEDITECVYALALDDMRNRNDDVYK